MTAKQLLTSNNVSPPVAAEALYAALDDLMARAGALTAERRCSSALIYCLQFNVGALAEKGGLQFYVGALQKWVVCN